MKIYEIGTGYTPIPARISAATEIVVEELTKAFQKQDVAVELIDIQTEDRLPNDLPITEIRVPWCFSGTDVQLGIMHKLKRVVYSVALAGELKKILKQTEDTVVFHFHNQYNLFFFLKLVPKSLRRRCIIAYTNHSGIWRLEWKEIEDTIKKRYFQEAECMKKADIVFLLNQETKQNIIERLGVEEKRIVVINNGVNTDIYHPLSEAEKEQAKQTGGLQGCKVILQVGSVYENKGQLRSVEYLLPLMKKYPDLVFAYAGGIVDESYQKKIQDFAQDNGLSNQIRYLGMLAPGRDLNELYNTAIATILPSKYEAFGLVAIESFAAGVPVLVDEAAPLCFGEGSVSYNSTNVPAVIEQLIFNNASNDRQLCVDARNNAVQNYGWNRIASDYLVGFNKIAG